ncbi:MAG: GntR family transcriptional regulator [Devosia sp.]|uniref:GntR family transcriptional regulator n=1 Tax=Devosia sp. TaxID=1871048 RepID=UPI001AD06F0A|nr:GntR family transcriptional regulator [Devosia sp.]MBN9317510.1 GntR family transcriptional regulator [Devosia sp.]
MAQTTGNGRAGGKGAQLRAYLLGLIDGELKPHEKLPTERELAESFGVTRLTVRRALDQLGYEGRVYRTQGAGTFVSEPRIAKSVELTSFTQDMRARGLVPGSLETQVEEIPAGAEIGARLALSPREHVAHLFRVRTADGEPMCIEHTYIPAKIAPGLAARAIEGSLYQLLTETYHLKVEKAEQSIHATVLDPPLAKLLGVPEFSPAFKVQRVAYDARNQRIEYAESVYRADRYSYDFIIYRTTRDTAN